MFYIKVFNIININYCSQKMKLLSYG